MRFRNNRVNGWISRKHTGADAAEYMAVELFHQKRFQRTPQEAGMQVRPVIRNQDHVGGVAGGMDLV